MRRAMAGLFGLVTGYAVAALLGYWGVEYFSGNTFDRSLEASMTSVFFYGPAGAIVGLVAGIVFGGSGRA